MMKNLLILTAFLLLNTYCTDPINQGDLKPDRDHYIPASNKENALLEEEEEEIDFICVNWNVNPQFPGGMNAFSDFIKTHIKYPPICAEGKVYISFVVETDGSLNEIEVVKGLHPLLDQEALRVMRSSPRWEPGKLRRTVVPVKMVAPILFRIE